MPDEKEYVSVLDVLSALKQAKDCLSDAEVVNASIREAIKEAEKLSVEILLEGKKLVAFTEAEVEAVQNATED